MTPTHKWKFFRAGGFDQVKLETGADLVSLGELDQKLWVALACPTTGLEIAPRTLALIDTDGDGRIRAPELVAAVEFACAHLKNPDDLFRSKAELPLAAIDDATPAGATLLAAARRILQNLGKPGATGILADDVADPGRIFADTPFNGDGVITELSAPDEPTRAVIRDVLACAGAQPDRSGKPGVDQAGIDAFFGEIDAYAAWQARAEAEASTVLPLGREGTAAAAVAVAGIRAKADDYFGRCRLAAFDPRAVPLLNRNVDEYLSIAGQDFSISADVVASFPLAPVAAGRALPLAGTVNPAHASAVEALRVAAVEPLLGARTSLAEGDWIALGARLAPYEAWRASKPPMSIDRLGPARIDELRVAGLKPALDALVAKDRALEPEATSLENVERLVLYHRDLVLLCTNFVSFKDFYDGDEPAIFQVGTLYLDQRSCLLCLPVEDAAKHAAMAALAGACLVYLDCARKSTGEKRQIVAAFTGGDSENLMVGRNGLFYDRKGRDWDATVTKIIDAPISLRQAFWAPYKKLLRFFEEQIAKRAAAADAEAHSTLHATAATTINLDKAKPPELKKKVDVGTVAALGVAVGAIGTFVTGLIGYATGVFRLGVLATAAAWRGG